MNYFKRDYVNGILRLCHRQSFRVLHATATGRISSQYILAMLNRVRVGISEPLNVIPSDLLTPEEAIQEYGVSERELRNWARRKRRPAPHYRLNRSTIRYSKKLLGEWLRENSK